MSLEGKIAIVTGAGSGIGRATAILFSQEGANVVLVGRRLEPLKETLNQLNGGRGLVVQADVSKSQDPKRIVEETLRAYGRVDILVNNAGVEGPHKSVTELSEEEQTRRYHERQFELGNCCGSKRKRVLCLESRGNSLNESDGDGCRS